MYREMVVDNFVEYFRYNNVMINMDIEKIFGMFKRKRMSSNDFEQSTNEELCNFYQSGKKEALDILLKKNKKLVSSRVSKYLNLYNNDLSFDDLMQNAYMGFIRAVEKFDITKNTKFSTYSVCWIDKEILKAIFDLGFSIRIPYHRFELIQKVWKLSQNMSKLSEKDMFSLVTETNSNKDRIDDTLFIISNLLNVTSLNNVVNSEESTEFVEFIPEDKDKGPEKTFEKKELNNTINFILSLLSEREQTVLKLRYGFVNDKCETLESIARTIGVSKERVRQIENAALRKIRASDYVSLLQDYA